MTVLETRGLVVRLGGRDVVDGVDVLLRPGWTAIVGPNGAGKSTLLRAMAGLIAPAQGLVAGRVSLDGDDLTHLSAATRARRIAWLAQAGETTGDLNVRETVGLGRIAVRGLHAAFGADDAQAVAQAMALTECEAWATRRLAELSGGERQRVLLARVLATGADVLLLDEPTTHLDAPHQAAMARLFRELAREGRCVVSVLHDLPVAVHAQRLIVMAQGRIRADGSLDDARVREALTQVFEGALRLAAVGPGHWQPQLAIDGTHADTLHADEADRSRS